MGQQEALKHRWRVVIMGTILQTCLGTVYAWSYFQKLLMSSYGWTNSQTAWTFSIAICALGCAAAWGGLQLSKIGAQRLAVAGSILFGLGYLIAAFALSIRNLPLLYLGYGFFGGVGLGLGYVTPVATTVKWFPQKKGLVTGIVVMGFGFGALLMSKVIAPFFIHISGGDLARVFLYTGVLMLGVTLPAAYFIKEPPNFNVVKPEPLSDKSTDAKFVIDLKTLFLSRQFIFLWLIFFMNITAGIMFVSFQSPMLQDLMLKCDGRLTESAMAMAGATLIAISSVFNGVGRSLWGALSDHIGQLTTFRFILGSQFLVFTVLPFVSQPMVFGILVCYVLLCYGGGFGTMPAFVLQIFGPKVMPVMYGAILTAWSAAGILGPQIVAVLKDHGPEKAGFYTFLFGAAFLATGFGATFMIKHKTRGAT